MARDYAKGGYSTKAKKNRKKLPARRNQKSSKKNTTQKRPALLFGGFLFAGILVGLFIAGLTYLGHQKSQAAKNQSSAPTNNKTTTTAKTETTRQKKHHTMAKAKPNPHFDFYTILQNKNIDNPSSENTTNAKALPAEYILQVASVKKFQDADRLRAQLLLLGYEVFINKSQSGNITWHRVNVGPFKTLKEAELKQDSLRQKEINSLLLKSTKNTA